MSNIFTPENRIDAREVNSKVINLVGEETAHELIQKFWRMDSYDCVLEIPHILDLFLEFIQTRHNKSGESFKRWNFYNFFIGKLVGNDKEFYKKLVELSLEMEVQQKNKYSKAEFNELLDNIQINKQQLLNTGLVEETEKEIGFYHHTFSEYIVASHILTKQDYINELSSYLLVKDDQQIVGFVSSWYGVTRFLLESKIGKEIRNWLLQLVATNSGLIDDGFCDTITSIDSELLDEDLKKNIFSLIYQTYLDKSVWVPIWTRLSLAKYCQPENYEELKRDFENSNGNKSEIYVKKGIIINIIANLMEDKNPLINREEKNYWKQKLIALANSDDENGVWRRHALEALSTYHDIDLIDQVKSCFNHTDSLVREEFIQFCYKTNPNSRSAIDWLVKGIVKEDTAIYSRHGFYEITTKKGLVYLLKQLGQNSKFLEFFLDKESIFNDEDRYGDEKIINLITKYVDGSVAALSKKIIRLAFTYPNIYSQEKSIFLKELAKIIRKYDDNYLFKVIDEIKNSKDKSNLLFKYEPLFSWILVKDDVKNFYDKLKDLDEEKGKRVASWALSGVNYFQKDETVYKKAIELGILEKPLLETEVTINTVEDKVYNEFLTQLGSDEEKTYLLSVFELFNKNKNVIIKKWTSEVEARFKKLIINEGLNKIDPKNIQVKIQRDEKGKKLNQYTISIISKYFGDVVRAAKNLEIDLKPYRNKIINFIPFAYSDDQRTIEDTISSLSDSDLNWVNERYLNDQNIRYFLPQSYINTIKTYIEEKNNKIKSAKRILLSFVKDKNIDEGDRNYALKTLGIIINSKDKKIEKILKKGFDSNRINHTAQDLLISVFKDEKQISSRINQIKKWSENAKNFKRPEGCHTVDSVELELDEMYLAKPLIQLKEKKYKKYIYELLNYSVELLKSKQKDNLWCYINYLWRIAVNYFENIENKNLHLIKEIENWFESNKETDGLNWFSSSIAQLKNSYLNEIIKKKNIEMLKNGGRDAEESR